MISRDVLGAVACATAALCACSNDPSLPVAADEAPVFRDSALVRPTDYREWQYVSTGKGMSYAGGVELPGTLFDNVFVRRSAYESFARSGTWPEQTIFVLELRNSSDKEAILETGTYQTDALLIEASVKDSARFGKSWAYFSFYPGEDGSLPATAEANPEGACFSCHAEHAQVDFTFAQFYPTFLPIAEQYGTVVNRPEPE